MPPYNFGNKSDDNQINPYSNLPFYWIPLLPIGENGYTIHPTGKLPNPNYRIAGNVYWVFPQVSVVRELLIPSEH